MISVCSLRDAYILRGGGGLGCFIFMPFDTELMTLIFPQQQFCDIFTGYSV